MPIDRTGGIGQIPGMRETFPCNTVNKDKENVAMLGIDAFQ
jgi:hypothetical protein